MNSTKLYSNSLTSCATRLYLRNSQDLCNFDWIGYTDLKHTYVYQVPTFCLMYNCIVVGFRLLHEKTSFQAQSN